jgi:predicted DNA-binding antitoxin AbrB/MazE fold protein
MVIRGRVQHGVVVLENQVSLPEGTEVTVEVCAAPKATGERMSEQERHRILEIMDRIAALPIEGDPEPFSGADHDKVLYGEP